MRRYRSPVRTQKGTALVEFALFLPLLLTLVLATVEATRALIAYTTVIQQARVAARFLSTQLPGDAHEAARCLAVHGVTSPLPCSGTPVLPGLAFTNVSIADAVTGNDASTQRMQRTGTDAQALTVNVVTVSITGYQHQIGSLAFVSEIFNNSPTITFKTISVSMRQQL